MIYLHVNSSNQITGWTFSEDMAKKSLAQDERVVAINCNAQEVVG